MAVGGGTGAARDEGEWLRAYGWVMAILPRVEALAAGRARLEAVNELQHEFWEARDALLQRRLLQAEESKRRWEAAYVHLKPSSSGDDRKFAELQESDFEDLTAFVDVLAAENTEFQIKVKEVDAGAEHSQYAADHEHITRDIEAELRKLKHAYEAFCSEKNREVSQLTAERDFARYQVKTLDPDYADLLSYRNTKAARAAEAAQELQQNVEQLQVASQKKEDEILRLRAQAKAAEAKRRLVEGKLQKVYCMPEEIDGENEKCKDRQPATSQKHKKDLSGTHKKGCSEGPALRTETKKNSPKQMLAYWQSETNQKRKCVTFLSDNDGNNGNGEEMCKQVVEPLKKKRASGKRASEQEGSKTELVDGKSHDESNRSPPHKLEIYNALLYLRSVKDSFTDDKPEKHAEFLSVQRKFVSRKIDADAFISAVKVLLDGHPELVRGFKSCFTCAPTQVLGSTDTTC